MVTDQEVREFAARNGITTRELENWRGKFVSRPLEQVGIGRGEGTHWLYPDSIFDELAEMGELKRKGYTRDTNETYWRRWENGHIEDWSHVEPILESSLPPLPDYENIDRDIEREVEPKLFPLFKQITRRWHPIQRLGKETLLSIVYYFGWPTLTGEHYMSDDPRRAIESVFSRTMMNIFDELERNHLADVRIWRAVVRDADALAASELAPVMRNVDKRFEMPDNQREYRLSRHRIFGKAFIWYARVAIFVLLRIEKVYGIRFSIAD